MRSALAVACLLAMAWGCGDESNEAPASPAAPSAVSSSVPTAAPVDHWIAVDGDVFIDRRTGEEFVPRGVNLLRKRGFGGDKLFEQYDPAWVEAQMAGIAGLGFNTVRVFADMCMECTATSSGIRDDLLTNLADLISRAAAHGLVVLVTSNDVPDPGYSDRLPCCEPFGGYRNSLYLSPEGTEIAAEYFRDLVGGLGDRGAPLEAVFAWQLANEQFVLRDVAPISLRTGEVVAADGETYDLADDEAVVAMVENSLLAYIDTVGETIRQVDPGSLVTMGFFAPEEPSAGREANDNRWVTTSRILRESTLDFADLHAYPGLGGRWDVLAPAMGLGDDVTMPVILGEFGAFTQAWRDHTAAAQAMVRWQVESCDYGFGGWLLWLWGGPTDDEVYPVENEQAAIASAVSPPVQPDPCVSVAPPGANLALGMPAMASLEESAEYAASRATDGSIGTWWSAGAGPGQWLEVDLGAPQRVAEVSVVIGPVAPAGEHGYRVLTGSESDGRAVTPAGEIRGLAVSGETLTLTLAPPLADVRFVRVEALSMDGWVIVHELEMRSPAD